jgi:APA family basic amino acid/polyamine antiporter
MGEFIAWIIGWDLVLEYALGAATVAISWSGYLIKFLEYYDLHIPPELTLSPFQTVTLADGSIVNGVMNLPAVFIIVVVSLVLIKGTKESALANAVIVALKVGVVLVFVILGWSYINPDNYVPYVPSNNGTFGEFGFSGIIRAAAIVFFAYIGFDAVSTAAQETRNPKRDMPIGILGSLVVCTILYILFAHVMLGLANYKEFAGKDGIAPVAVAIAHTPYVFLQQAVILAILAGYSSVILVMLMGQSRVFYSMSHDGLLPKLFSEVHPRFQTPYKSNLLFMLFVSLFAAFVPANVVGEMVSIGTLFAFVLVCIGIWVLRVKQPDAPRTFRVPMVPLIPILGVATCLFMMAFLPVDTWVRLIVWMAIGIVIYFLYSKDRSVLRKSGKGEL